MISTLIDLINSIRDRWQSWRLLRKRERQLQRDGYLCICPECHEDADAPDAWSLTHDESVYRLACPHCGHVSRWFFGAPVPILLAPSTETPTCTTES